MHGNGTNTSKQERDRNGNTGTTKHGNTRREHSSRNARKHRTQYMGTGHENGTGKKGVSQVEETRNKGAHDKRRYHICAE